ncbi:Acetylornithine deacetylase/Succinyl-diaminopimelate desuccinylase [Verrucomicrobium sp. GAS474]|uniref:dipeptidase n=1 Tax=Verrucomicrobium sp. GAS474 TaxID=1882831 RepID=UPI00087BEE2C|nr:dipeptidase [Verrucomicrobium sp. GAS474]SDU10083.1 Acetylornithine deacetylase/Succinyl-diaminopimelate desuccinylase [Verrucomicrobium sp. GAS474]
MNGSHLDDFLRFLSFPSVSADSAPAYRQGVKECSEWLAGRLRAAGLVPEIHETPGNPIVVARNAHAAGLPTVLIYGHYDVQPVDPLALWHHPPFEPHVENGIVTARGSADNKGQILAHILGVEEGLKEGNGKLPVNLIFLIEGEEEIGSPNLAPFLEAHKEAFRCDGVVISDSPMIAPGVPTLTYGLRGVAAMEVSVYGPAKDLHSGMYGGAVENPVTVLARLVASLHQADGSVAVPGFYDGVEPVAAWEREEWAKLPFGAAELLAASGAPALGGENHLGVHERLWARPTAEVNGLYGGYQGEGSKTVLPAEAHAKLTFRLVPGQDSASVLAAVEAHLRAKAPGSVRLVVTPGHAGEAYVTSPITGWGAAAQSALRIAFPGKEIALTREGGSIPIVGDFRRILGVDTLLLGLCLPDCNAHSPNETFPLANLEAGIRLNRALLPELGAIGGGKPPIK